MQLSKNFSLKEMTRSQTATRKGIDNNPTGTHQSNLVLLCQNILQPLRDYYGRPLRVSSGYMDIGWFRHNKLHGNGQFILANGTVSFEGEYNLDF